MKNAVTLQSLDSILYAGGDDPKPDTNQNHFRLYGHNLCPFTARARYALALKGISFQECHMDLNNKSRWHRELNDGGIPVLETPCGDQIIESDIMIRFAEEYAPHAGVKLIPSDPIEAA